MVRCVCAVSLECVVAMVGEIGVQRRAPWRSATTESLQHVDVHWVALCCRLYVALDVRCRMCSIVCVCSHAVHAALGWRSPLLGAAARLALRSVPRDIDTTRAPVEFTHGAGTSTGRCISLSAFKSVCVAPKTV